MCENRVDFLLHTHIVHIIVDARDGGGRPRGKYKTPLFYFILPHRTPSV